MKLCWDNIENIRLTKNGKFKDIVKNLYYVYHEHCNYCKEEFLGYKKSKFCSTACRNKYIGCSDKTRKKLSNIAKKNNKSEKNPNWKGGYRKNSIPAYDTYAHQLEWCEEVRRNKEDPNILEVKCFKCDKWFVPTYNNIINRVQVIKGNYRGEQHFYCSNKCKNICSVYYKSAKILMRQDAIKAGRLSWTQLEREVQPELRQIVLERDEHKCVKCRSKKDLQCHHIYPEMIEPLLSADVDNCITLCIECHIKVHKKDGCRYSQLHIKEC